LKKLVAIHLHGPLGERYGPLHKFAVQSPREALHALDANYPGFIAAFAAHERYGIMVDDEWREGDNAAIMPASKEIHFVPAIEGEVPIVAVGLTAAFGLSATAATIIGSLLVTGLMIGLSLLFRPKQPKQAEEEEMDDSYIFSGPENVTGQGVAVPLIYGRVYAGSVVVSAGQDTIDLITTTAQAGNPKPASGSSSKPSGYSPPVYRGGRDGRANEDGVMAKGFSRMAMAMDAPVAVTTYVTQTQLVPPPAVSRQYSLNGVYVIDAGERGYALPSAYVVERMGVPAIVEEPYSPWPDMVNEGAGIEHLREPPVDGWPEIIEDPVYTFKPEGWIPVKSIWVTNDDAAHRKQVYVWQPDYETVDYVYNWNMVRGFYVTEVPVVNPDGGTGTIVYLEAEENEWIAGADVEIPVVNPSP
jgi:predicted phage tail protein